MNCGIDLIPIYANPELDWCKRRQLISFHRICTSRVKFEITSFLPSLFFANPCLNSQQV
jgi:hypothetical protein